MEDEENFLALPLEARLDHKSWKARLCAYEELQKLFQKTTDSHDPIFREHFDNVRKAPSEANAAALDAALGALALFIGQSDSAVRLRPIVLSTVIEKGLGAARALTRTKALEIILEFVAIDSAEAVVSALGEFLTHRQPKLITASVSAITEIVKNYGAMTAGVKSIVKFVPGIFAHADKNVRAEGAHLVLELYRWIGPSISVAFEGLKPVQVKELQDSISKIAIDTPPKPLRWRRCEQPPADHVPIPMDTTGDGGSLASVNNNSCASMNEIIDAYSLADPVNVLERMPPNFGEACDSTKWKERKETLDALLAILKVPKIEDGHFGPLVTALSKKVAGDVNVTVVATAAQCLEALSLGLRKKFAPYRGETIPSLLERCKEKNKMVIEALRAALDSMFHCLSCVGEICEVHVSFFKHKNPQVRAECLSWLSRAVPVLFRAQQAKKEFKSIADVACPCLDDSSAEVRDAASTALASLIKVAGEKAVMPFLDKVEKLKLSKILEMATIAAPPSAVTASVTVPSIRATKDVDNTAGKVQRSVPSPAVPANKINSHHAAARDTVSVPRVIRSKDESLNMIKSVVGEEIIAGLYDTNWKQRLASIDAIASKFEYAFPAEVDADVLALSFAECPGWKESNFQVLGKVFAILTSYAEKVSFSPEAASCVIQGASDKISDAKLGTGVGLLFLAIAERVGLTSCLSPLIDSLKSMKNPKSLSESLNWIANAILDFGIQGLDVQALVACTKFGISNSNPAVRASAIKVAATLRRFVGQTLLSLYSDLPPAQIGTLEAEFGKVSSEPIPQPIRRVKANAMVTECVGGLGASAYQAETHINDDKPVEIDSLVPRNDITETLLPITKEISDANWKVRKEGMERLAEILRQNGGRVNIANNEVFVELKQRFSDSNKNLITMALDLTTSCALAMGPAFERNGAQRIVLGPAVSTLTDNKPQIRASALKFLSSCVTLCSLDSMSSTLASSLATDSPNLRKELLAWLSENLATLGKLQGEDRLALLGAFFNCLQDRAQEVRKAATLAIDAALDAVGPVSVLQACQSRKPALLPQVKQIAEAHKPPTLAAVQPVISPEIFSPKTPQKSTFSALTGTPRRDSKAPEAGAENVFLVMDQQGRLARSEQETRGGLKWAFENPRVELYDHLRNLMTGSISATIVKLLFSDDFKEVIQGMSLIDTILISGEEKDGALANVDLLLKYISIRLFDTNTSVLIKTFELLEHLLSVVDEANVRLNENEASSLLSHFVLRAGELKEPMKSKVRGIYRQLCRVYPASKIFAFLVDGLRAKSSRARVECLNEMGVLVSRNGLMVIQPPKHVPVAAALVADRDSQVRNSALNFLVQLHELLGDNLYKHMSGMAQKDLDMFKERLRRFKAGAGLVAVEEPHQVNEDEMQIDEIPAAEMDIARESSQEPTANDPKVPQVFSLDPAQLGSPARPSTFALRESICATPLVNSILGAAPTPAMPTLSNPFFVAPPKLEDPLDVIIQAITCSPDLDCVSALQRLDEYFTIPSSLAPKLDSLFCALTVRLHECTHSMADVDCIMKSRLCRYVTNALILLVTEKSGLVRHLNVSSLTILLRETLLGLVSEQVVHLEDRDHLIRSLNSLLIKCLECCHPNACYRSLISLLEQAFRVPPTADDKYPEFVMKSLWKLTKGLAGHINERLIDIPQLLLDVHSFLCSLPPMEWKTRAAQGFPMQDLPLRTMKTILQEIVNIIGPSLIPILREMQHSQQSFVTSYVRAMLVASNVDVSELDFTRYPLQAASPFVSSVTSTTQSAMFEEVSQLPYDQLEEALKDICSKICSKPNTRAGLSELYDLQKQHPYAANFIDSYLEKLGNFFYKYIKRNLAHLEAEVHRTTTDSARQTSTTPIEAYKSKLTQMQMQMQMHIFGKGGMVVEGMDSEMVGIVGHHNPSITSAINIPPEMPSPVRKRLDSPAAKGMPRTPLRHSVSDDMLNNTPGKDSTIMGLKERLARLRNERADQPAVDPHQQH